MQAVIVAGGKGTRLRERLGDLPKPMVALQGKPLLEWQIELLRAHGFRDIVLLLGYNPDTVRNHFGDGTSFGVRIRYKVESTPLGSAGAVLSALPALDERFLVLYGDTALNVDLGRFYAAHRASNADASLFLHPNDHPYDSDLVEIGSTGRITALHPKPRAEDRSYANLVNAALYALEKNSLTQWQSLPRPLDFGRDLFGLMLRSGQSLHGYKSREYIKDIGTPDRLDRVERDLSTGRMARSSLSVRTAAVFLDRDGTINEEVNRVSNPGQFRLIPNAATAIRDLNRAGLPVIVVTNQPVIARGDCSEDGLREIHNKMESLLGRQGAYVDAIYYCPHHPDRGFEGERPELKVACSCRKPAAGLLETASIEMNLDLTASWLVGDSAVDIETGLHAGVRSILVETGITGSGNAVTPVPHHRCATLNDAVDVILAASQPDDYQSNAA